jgi:hypothetical protein
MQTEKVFVWNQTSSSPVVPEDTKLYDEEWLKSCCADNCIFIKKQWEKSVSLEYMLTI